MASKTNRKRVCIIGCGPAGMSALYHYSKMPGVSDTVDLVCYEKKSDWGGLWNIDWRTGRFTKKPVQDLRQFIKFQTLVNHVEYSKKTDDFIVRTKDQPTSRETTERFTHVIVASGTFAYAEKPSFPGLSEFKGRILHSQDIKHMDAFRNQKILIIGARWSAEDLALQAFKYGAEHVIISWRTMPHGQDWFEFPEGIEQRPLVEKVDSNSAWFKDGKTAEVDSIIFCTGYRWHFPFLAEDLRVPGQFFCSRDFYKWTLWLNGGNNKLMYIGAPYNFYTLTLIEAQATWVWRYITGAIKIPSHAEMLADADKWLEKLNELKFSDCREVIRFCTEILADVCEAGGHNKQCTKAIQIYNEWWEFKKRNILTFRDIQAQSVYTGKVTPLHHTPWMKAFDYSMAAFGLVPLSAKMNEQK